MHRWFVVTVLAGCGSNGVTYARPGADAVDSCSLVEKRYGSILQRNELWFDAKGRTIQINGFDGSYVLSYDDSDRLVHATTPAEMITWTYEPAVITSVSSLGYTFVYNLDADGRATRFEGPEELEASQRNSTDFQYDTAGNVTSEVGQTRYSETEGGPVMIAQFQITYTYDDQERLASAKRAPTNDATTYTYTATPGHLTIALAGNISQRTYTYDFDEANRIGHAAVAQVDSSGTTASSGYAYTYTGDSVTAVSDDGLYEVDSTGACPGIAPTVGPAAPLPIDLSGNVVKLPNPPSDDFDAEVY